MTVMHFLWVLKGPSLQNEAAHILTGMSKLYWFYVHFTAAEASQNQAEALRGFKGHCILVNV